MGGVPADTPLFRYYDLLGFLYLMARRVVRFSRISKWPDKFEGVSYKFSAERICKENSVSCINIWGSCWTEEKDIKECHPDEASQRRANEELYRNGSAAMWGSYCGEGGVRVKSTVGKIETAIVNFLDTSGASFKHGSVKYIPGLSPHKDPMKALFHKRVPFRYESEYRFIIVDKSAEFAEVEVPLGNPFDFFDEILVSPTTSTNAWVTDMVYQAIASSAVFGGDTVSGKQFARKSQLFEKASEESGSSFLRFIVAKEAYQAFEQMLKGSGCHK